jgi:surface polysaccharide O-acyltransferase-like enzyme
LLIQKLAAYSLGVYLLHIIIVEAVAHLGLFKRLDCCVVLVVSLTAFIIFLMSNIIIALLYRIKWFRKYFL